MEWISNYGRFGLVAMLIIVGLIAILWSRAEIKKVDDPEMNNVAKAFGVVGWMLMIIGLAVMVVALV